MKKLYGLASVLVVGCTLMPAALAYDGDGTTGRDWTKSKCMNFRSNKDVSVPEMALKTAHSQGDRTAALELARELMANKLGCQQRYDIADIGYQSAVILKDFSSAQQFMPLMRKYLKKKGRDVKYFDQLIKWVDENQAARDPNVEVEDRQAFAVRDRTLYYVLKDFQNNNAAGRRLPQSKCKLEFAISEYGRPQNVEATCDREDVAASLKKHAPKMLFAPKILDGRPVVQERYLINVNLE